MSRTAITYRNLVKNGSLDGVTGPVTIDSTLVTAGAYIANAVPERTLIRVTNTEADDNVLTIPAGATPTPALRAKDVTCTVVASTGIMYFGPFESDQVLQADGSMRIDFESGFVGKIDVLKIPRG